MKKILSAFALLLVPALAQAQQLCPVGTTSFNGQCLNNPQGTAIIGGQTGTGASGQGGSIVLAPGAPAAGSTKVGNLTIQMDPTNPGVNFQCSNPTQGGVNTAQCAFNGISGVTGGLPAIANNTILGNNSGSTAQPTALNPLAVANMQSAVVSAWLVATSNLATLSGAQTIDSAATSSGEIVLLTAQTTTTQNGLWLVQSGAWVRPANFPTGYAITQNCSFVVEIQSGAAFGGSRWALGTASGALIIDTNALSFTAVPLQSATHTVLGAVKITTNGNVIVPSLNGGAIGGNSSDCTSFATASGDVGDVGSIAGVFGPCTVTDANGNIAAALNNAHSPTVTGTGCSLGTGSTNNSGTIVATGVDTCTVTWGGTAWQAAPFCVLAGYSATVLPFISTAPTTTQFIMKTAAAGTSSYVCM